MKWKVPNLIALAAGAAVTVVALGGQSLLLNGSKEQGNGPASLDPQVADVWSEFGINVERSTQYNVAPANGVASLKAFGDPGSTSCGVNQTVNGISAGQSVTASVKLYTAGNDKLGGTGSAGIVVQFRGTFNNLISSQQAFVLNAASPPDTWIPATVGPIVAPAGTAKVQIILRLDWSGAVNGACWWDDAQLIVNGSNLLLNGNFETAGLAQGRPCPGHAQSPIGISDWQGFNDQEKSSAFAKHGVSSEKLGICDPYSGLYQAMGVGADGDRIRMLAYAWNSSANPLTANTRVGLKLEFFVNGDTPPPEQNLAFTAASAPNTWTTVSLNTVVPPSITGARLVLIYVGDASTANSYVYIDSANAERGSSPGVNQLLNESFENGPGGTNGLDNWTEFFSTGTSEARKDCFTQSFDGICSTLARGAAVSGVYQSIPVTAGEALNVSARFLTPSGANQLAGTGVAGVKIEWVNGSIPAAVDIGVANSSPNTIGAGAATDTWIPMTIDYTMPAGTNAGLRFVELIEAGAGTAGCYIDSAEAVVQNRYNGSDMDNNNKEDMRDFAGLQRAFAGTGVTPSAWPWLVFDSDADNDVDLTDSAYFYPRMTGP